MKKSNRTDKRHITVGRRKHSLANRILSGVLAISTASLQVMPAYAAVLADGVTATTVSVAGGVTDVTTTTIVNNTGFNSFSEFNIGALETVNIFQPTGADALVNIIRSSSVSQIDGTLNTRLASAPGAIGGNVFFVNPDGFIISNSGVINAGQLTLSTSTGGDLAITEAMGTGTTFVAGAIMDGSLALGVGDIEVYGSITARRLELRAGARMVLNGSISVADFTESGTIAPAVNTDGVPTAAGATVSNGVIRLFSGGTMEIGGSVAAHRDAGGSAGGLIEAVADGNLTVEENAQIDVSGSGAGNAGSVILFTKGSAILEVGQNIDAHAVNGDGGMFLLWADKSATINGTVSTNSDTGAAGDQFYIAPDINVTVGADLQADGIGADNGGLIALLARDNPDAIVWAIDAPSSTATINITDADISAGSVVVSAFALVSNVGTPEDIDTGTTDADGNPITALTTFLDDAVDTFTSILQRGLVELNALSPVQVSVMEADATITVTNARLTANGNWDDSAASVSYPDDAANADGIDFADNGQLDASGLVEFGYGFFGADDLQLMLPAAFDTANDSLYIQSHAQTDVSAETTQLPIVGDEFPIQAPSIFVAVTDTNSRVKITGSTLITNAGNMVLASTAVENLSLSAEPAAIADKVALGIVVSSRNLTNQLLVDGGVLNSAGSLSAAAWTGKSHALSNVADAGISGIAAIAVTVSVGTSLTEAAISGDIDAGGDLSLDAETLYFAKLHTGTTTMGLEEPALVGVAASPAEGATDVFTGVLQSLILGEPIQSDPEKRKRKYGPGAGITVDLQFDDDNTFATLGGSYRDLDNANALTLLPTTTVDATGAVNVNAALRFARVAATGTEGQPDYLASEGGSGFQRNITAEMGSLSSKWTQLLATIPNPEGTKTQQQVEDEALGEYGNAVFLSLSVSSMTGDTQAEIGGNATINANALEVSSLTKYNDVNPFAAIKTAWEVFSGEVSDFNLTEAVETQEVLPSAPDLIALISPLGYLTTDTAAKAGTPSLSANAAKAKDQSLAIGITVNYFSTDNTTTAVIRDGAVVNVATTADVSALQEALFLHAANLPKSPSLGGGPVNNGVGGAINVARAASTVQAIVESGSKIDSGDLTVEAETNVIQANLAFAGGSAKEVAINAGIAANIQEANTYARVGAGALINANDFTITALDRSIVWGLAGGVSSSESTGVGASGVVNFVTRDIIAGVSDDVAGVNLDPAAGIPQISARNLVINATNSGMEVAVGVAGAKVAGSTTLPDGGNGTSTGTQPTDTDDGGTIIPSWLFSDDENDALTQQNNVTPPADSEGDQSSSTGWAVAGVATVNLMLGNNTEAQVVNAGAVDLTGAMTVAALNNNLGITFAGAVAAGVNATEDANAIAGAFAIHVDERNVRTRIVGTSVTAGGAVKISTKDMATVVDIAIGGAGTSKGNAAVAGSVALSVLTGSTTTEVLDSDISGATVVLETSDESLTVGVAGAIAINLDVTKGSGVGIGISANVVDRVALTSVKGASTLSGASVTATANTKAQIFGFGTSMGAGKTGIAGSVALNTLTGGAKVLIEGTGTVAVIIEADDLTVTATEQNEIWSLGGALTMGNDSAYGGALTVNLVSAGTEAALRYAKVTSFTAATPVSAVTIDANSSSTIGTIAVAGAAGLTATAVGVGISVNKITAGTTAAIENSQITDVQDVTVTADGARIIRSLAGGVAIAGGGGGGIASTINLLLANDTIVSFDGSTITGDGALIGTATASGEITTAGVAISGASSTSIAGAVTVNDTTGGTKVTAVGADLEGGSINLAASDTAAINSLAGGAALSGSGAGVGAGIAVNIIAHDTAVIVDGGSLNATTGNLDLTAANDATINTAAIGLGVASSSAVAGSIAIGDIGNSTRVNVTGADVEAANGAITLDADKNSTISILAGAAAVGGSNAVGAAISVAVIHDTVTADLSTGGIVAGNSLQVSATNASTINALSAAGSVGGSAAFAGSIVYTQIGKPSSSAPSVDPIANSDGSAPTASDDDTIGQAQDDIAAARDSAMASARTSSGRSGLSLSLDTDDITRARVQITNGDVILPDLTIAATETSNIDSFGGAVSVGGSGGIGAGLTLNLLFGKTEAELVLPAGTIDTPAVAGLGRADQVLNTTDSGSVSVTATQGGSIETIGAAAAGGGSVGVGGAVTINVMDRSIASRIIGVGDNAGLATDGGDVIVSTNQTGTISSLAGSAGVGGNVGVGAAVAVNVLSDDAEAKIENVVVDARDTTGLLANAGSVSVTNTQDIDLTSFALSIGGGGYVGVAGGFGINVANGSVESILRGSDVLARTVSVTADSDTNVVGIGEVAAISGAASVGLGVVTNTSTMTVRSDVDASRVRADGSVAVTADAVTGLSGNALTASLAGGVAVTGSAVSNITANTVEALVRNETGADTAFGGFTFGGSDLITNGSLVLRATGTNTIGLMGGSDGFPDISGSLTFGGAAGIGAAVTVNSTKNRITAAIEDGSRVVGLGNSSINAGRLGYIRGVAVDAYGATDITQAALNAAAGGTVGVAGLFTFNVVDDQATVRLGDGTLDGVAYVNGVIDAFDLAAVNGVGASVFQDTILSSKVDNTVESYAIALGIGGTAGVGAASSTTWVTSKAETVLELSQVRARDGLFINATADTELDTYVLGLGGGFVGAAASANVNRIASKALVNIRGASVRAGEVDGGPSSNVTIATNVNNDATTFVGGLAGGAVGAAGAVQVNLFESTSKIAVDKSSVATGSIASRIDAFTSTVMAAKTDLTTETTAASGAGGGFGLAISANISLVEAETAVEIAGDQTISAGRDISLTAVETVDITGNAGAVAGGMVGIGASLDYANFAGRTAVDIGANVRLLGGTNSTPGTAGDITINATATRELGSTVGVAGVGGYGAAVALSVIEMGALVLDPTGDGERNNILEDTNTELASDGETGTSADSVGGLVGTSGGTSTRDSVIAARQSIVISDAAGTDVAKADNVGVTIGANADIQTNGNIGITGTALTSVKQFGGALAGGTVAGIASGVVVADVSTGAEVTIGNRASLRADGNVTIEAKTGSVPGEADTIFARAATVSGGGAVGVGVGVVASTLSGSADVTLGDGVNISGLFSSGGNTLLSALRTDSVSADVYNLVVGGLAGVGAVVVDATNVGSTNVSVGTSRSTISSSITTSGITLRANDATSTSAIGIGSSGGVGVALNGVTATARNNGTGTVSIYNASLDGNNVTVENLSSGRASATATGVAIAGLVAAGGSFANAKVDTTLTTNIIDSTVLANGNIGITTRYNNAGGTNSYAFARSASGGLLSGSGAEADARLDYSVRTNIDANLIANNAVTVISTAEDVKADAQASGLAIGGIAIGVTIARSGQSDSRVASVTTDIISGAITGETVDIDAKNAPNLQAHAVSGSGGLVSGSGSETEVTGNTKTLTDIGSGGLTTITAINAFIRAEHAAELGSSVDTTSASAVGVSGANSQTSLTTDVDTTLGGQTVINAFNIDLDAKNSVYRPDIGYNVVSGSGGAIDVAAMVSNVDIYAYTDFNIQSGARITQLGEWETAGSFLIGVATDMDVTDRMKLDSGGAIAVPIGDSDVIVHENTAKVTVGNATLTGVGKLRLYAGGDADLFSEVDTKAYGLAGAASAFSKATYNSVQEIALNNGALIESDGDIELMAGSIRNSLQSVAVNAESRVFNATAFPINTDPTADATANTRSTIDIGANSEVISIRDIYLFAEAGGRDVEGYGRAKDLYSAAAEEIVNGLGGLVGADDVSLDIETGTTTDTSNDGIQVDGYVRAGADNQQIMILDANNNLLSGNLIEGVDWNVQTGVNPVQDVVDRIAVLTGYIADFGNLDDKAKLAWEAEIAVLTARLPDINAAPIDKVVVNAITAVEGNIITRADHMYGGVDGVLEAPGDALIQLTVTSGAYLEINDLTIPTDAGGRITFNGVTVYEAADVAALTSGTPGVIPAGLYDYTLISADPTDPSTDPRIEVTTNDTVGSRLGSIVSAGNVSNFRGDVLIRSNLGDLDVRGNVLGKNITLYAGRDFVLGYQPGVRNVSSSPEALYHSYFQKVQAAFRGYIKNGHTATNLEPGDRLFGAFGPRVTTFSMLTGGTGIGAGRNVYITADTLNINGLIKAGRGEFSVDIGANIDTYLDNLAFTGTSRVRIYDPAEPYPSTTPEGVELVYRNANIQSDVAVYYNFDTDQIEIDPMIVQGGQVHILGNIISTGTGRIEALDGFGEIVVNSDTRRAVVFGRIDTGTTEFVDGIPVGIQGLVRITDTSKTVSGGGGPANRYLITEFAREVDINTGAKSLVIRDNRTQTVETVILNAETGSGFEVITPTYEVSRTLGARTSLYTPTQNRDLIVLTSEETVVKRHYVEEKFYVFSLSNDAWEVDKTKTTYNETTPTTDKLKLAPYVGDSVTTGAADDYAYNFSGRRTAYNSVSTPKVVTDDERKWYTLASGWVTTEWDATITTSQLYTHRLKADYNIDIAFTGADAANLDIQTVGDAVFGSAVLNAQGPTSVLSSAGDILTTNRQMAFFTDDTTLTATNGRIGGIDGAFRMDQTVGGTISAEALGNIEIEEIRGDMLVAKAVSTGATAGTAVASEGDISLYAAGSLLQVGVAPLVSGANIDLTSRDGAITHQDASAFRIDTIGSGVLTANAALDVNITETTGDLGVSFVTSSSAGVTLNALTGSLLDRNDIESSDVRTEAELTKLWTEDLGLYGIGLADVQADQLAALKAEREHAYALYWQERDIAGTELTFTMAAADQQNLLDGGWTADQLSAYITERETLYTLWNLDAAYDAGYVYAPNAAEQTAILEGAEWTANTLTRSIRAGLVRPVADTQTRIETPNVTAAGDIQLFADGSIGELLAPYQITAGTNLTASDLLALSTAERTDITIDADQNVLVRQDENFNFAFSNFDLSGASNGMLTAVVTNGSVFLGSETAATIERVNGPGDVQILVSGDMTNGAAVGQIAITGKDIVLESGNTGSIGRDGEALTLDILTNGSLTARSGANVYLSTPTGDMPVSAIYGPGTVSLSALGAITDVVVSGLPRILAGNILLSGGSIGSGLASFGIKLVDPLLGAVSLETLTGDAFVTAYSDLPLTKASIFGGGEIIATTAFKLMGNNTISFGTGSTLKLIAPTGIDLSSASGVDVAGGTLQLISGGGVGTLANPLNTEITQVSFTSTGGNPTPLYMTEADDLRVDTVTQNANADSITWIDAAGDMSVGTITSVSSVWLDAVNIADGRIVSARTDLFADETIGQTSRMDVTTSIFKARTLNGSADILLRDRAVDIESIVIGGAGDLDLESSNAPVILLAGAGISTGAGNITARLTSLAALATIKTTGGNVDITSLGNLTQAAGTQISSASGTAKVVVNGNMTLAQILTTNATDAALSLQVDGVLNVAANTNNVLVANTTGALTTLRVGTMAPVGPTGLKTQIARLDSIVATGAQHINEVDGLILESVISQTGQVDVFTGGETLVKLVEARGDAPRNVTISALGDIIADSASISGTEIRLYAFGGGLIGETGRAFSADTSADATVYLVSQDDLFYTESVGDLRLGFALADQGDLELATPDGSMVAGILGTPGNLMVSTLGDLSINVIGRAEVDLADEVALQLDRPEFYGRRVAKSPANVDLTAQSIGASIWLGLGTVKDTVALHADEIDAKLADETESNGLRLTIDDASGDFAELVDVDVIDNGPTIFFADPFADVRPSLTGRDVAQGVLTLELGRIGTGEVTHAGPLFFGEDIVINGDVWFRQRSFDLFSLIDYQALSTVDDAQVYAIDEGKISFMILDEIVLTTEDVLVLNRKLGGVDLNGGQGFAFEVGVETGILGNPFLRNLGPAGVVLPLFTDEDETESESHVIVLPLILARAE